ncbi:hypothetical protein BM1374166_01822 [Bartonella tribocorum]|nr:hypothetical protein BM1374166_01822 [Bartonella tribocorum]
MARGGKEYRRFLGAVVLEYKGGFRTEEKEKLLVFSDSGFLFVRMLYVCSPFCFPQDNYFFLVKYGLFKKNTWHFM